jgi:hypothetical protein
MNFFGLIILIGIIAWLLSLYSFLKYKEGYGIADGRQIQLWLNFISAKKATLVEKNNLRNLALGYFIVPVILVIVYFLVERVN